MSDPESRPPPNSSLGCFVWFGAVVAYPLGTLAIFNTYGPSAALIFPSVVVGIVLTLVASTVLARAMQLDPDARSPVGLAIGLFLAGLVVSAAVFFFGCSMAALKGI
jgi:hypothetical protein